MSGQALVFVVRTVGYSLIERAGTSTYVAFFMAQVWSRLCVCFMCCACVCRLCVCRLCVVRVFAGCVFALCVVWAFAVAARASHSLIECAGACAYVRSLSSCVSTWKLVQNDGTVEP